MKNWGGKEFWGASEEYDPDWFLTPEQKKLRDDLIELCRTVIRPKAADNDKYYRYPRESLDSLSSLGLLGLIVPKEYGGLEQNFVCCAMVLETIARYGSPSVALIYCMHLLGLAGLLYRKTDNPEIIELLKTVNSKKLIGTVVTSDPGTGGHFWFPLTSKSQHTSEEEMRFLKYGSWATSAGHADWYLMNCLAPDYNNDHSKMIMFICYRDEIRAYSEEWSAMGMHGNMSGEVIVDATLPKKRIVGEIGELAKIIETGTACYYYLASTATWNGIAMGCIDLAKKHTTRKNLGDVGIRVCDFASVQDYVGRSLCQTNAHRLALFSVAQQLDAVSKGHVWTTSPEFNNTYKSQFNFWLQQQKHNSSENSSAVADMMMKACGGTGYKTDLGLERLLRDSKAGGVMSASNEMIRLMMGQAVLCGADTLDLWHNSPNKRTLHQELTKMSLDDKKTLAKSLIEEIQLEEQPALLKPFDDFDNPFNTAEPKYLGKVFTQNGRTMRSALNPHTWTSLVLKSVEKMTSKMSSFRFSLPTSANHSGLIPGQYVTVRISTKDSGVHERYFSPVSLPDNPDIIELVLRFESHGILSKYFQNMKTGDTIECKGPCGGFEYESNTLQEMTLLASGGGITPGLQVIRYIMENSSDKTKVKLLYFSDSYDEILYREELDQYAAKNPGKLTLVHSLGEAPENWTGEEGFLDEGMLNKHLKKDLTDKHKIVICGGPNMSLTVCYALRAIGFQSSQVFIFGQFGTIQVKRVFGKNCKLTNQSSHCQ